MWSCGDRSSFSSHEYLPYTSAWVIEHVARLGKVTSTKPTPPTNATTPKPNPFHLCVCVGGITRMLPRCCMITPATRVPGPITLDKLAATYETILSLRCGQHSLLVLFTSSLSDDHSASSS